MKIVIKVFLFLVCLFQFHVLLSHSLNLFFLLFSSLFLFSHLFFSSLSSLICSILPYSQLLPHTYFSLFIFSAWHFYFTLVIIFSLCLNFLSSNDTLSILLTLYCGISYFIYIFLSLIDQIFLGSPVYLCIYLFIYFFSYFCHLCIFSLLPIFSQVIFSSFLLFKYLFIHFFSYSCYLCIFFNFFTSSSTYFI